ncbi:AimR family lysis-lysogeny pheromone receptor [Aquibacillus salsiterrae]|uniref:AimR family lysis-lysogeny pheromone receptor n=1 Tax=Aquibacillus salsiterrae TaxID=2950439 RepID=A0A9X4AG13_9BACI|nr:AimR family lysis-lysogeny pheromone receptor [Aquibacillus salsiterrae]MDC3416800.1 AimR family lysis-lysogeny pheromone receptor [Aquibacillus salsiterrae]
MTSNQSRFSHWEPYYINGKELPLHQVYQLTFATLDQQKAIETMRQLCLTASTDENKRIGLEFLYSYGFLSDVQELIEQNLQTKNPVNHRWAAFYQIIYDRKRTKNQPYDFTKTKAYLEKVKRLSFHEDELKCLSDFMHIYAYFELKQYNNLGHYADQLFTRIFYIEDPLLKELFSIRLDEVQVIFHWKRNEMIIARKFGYRILNTTGSLRKKVEVNNLMALGYVFDSYDQAMIHINRALTIANGIELMPAINGITNFTIPFISAYHGVTDGITTTDKAEQAHLALARGDRETCIQLLSEFESLSPFQQYYLGKALGDKALLEESRHRFIKEQSDYFYVKLPINELQKMKVNYY